VYQLQWSASKTGYQLTPQTVFVVVSKVFRLVFAPFMFIGGGDVV
jgi:hypothetical protein